MEIILFLIGGAIYYNLEILWRGYSHWTMFILGGLCFLIIGLLNEYKFSWNDSILTQAMIGSIAITTLEFIAGCILNLWLGLDIWDYSDLPFNILGQVCPQFIILWFFLSILAIFLDDWIRYLLYKLVPKLRLREKPHYNLKTWKENE